MNVRHGTNVVGTAGATATGVLTRTATTSGHAEEPERRSDYQSTCGKTEQNAAASAGAERAPGHNLASRQKPEWKWRAAPARRSTTTDRPGSAPVRQRDVGVQVWVPGAAVPVGERRGHQPGDVHLTYADTAFPGEQRPILDEPQRLREG